MNITCDPFAGEEDVPEPDWNQLRELLVSAQAWLRSDNSDNLPVVSMLASEAVQTCTEMLDMTLDADGGEGKTNDEVVRRWVERVEWGAWWFAGMVADPALCERVLRLVEDPDEIQRGLADASERAWAEISSEGRS